MENITMPIKVMTFKVSGEWSSEVVINARIDTWHNIVEHIEAERSFIGTSEVWVFGHDDCHDGAYPIMLKG